MEYLIYLAISFAITVVCMPMFISYFNKRKIGQTIREEGPSWHEEKAGTPTMGGTIFIIAILITLLLAGLIQKLIKPAFWMIFLAFLGFGAIGFLDDFISIFKEQNEGLTAKQKFISQLLISLVIMLIAVFTKQDLKIPLGFTTLKHPIWLVLFGVFWITGFSNAVNLTDGLDGLAAGLNIFAYGAYFVVAMQQKQDLIALVCLIVVGSLLGFLYYNIKPAKIFMGDVGSLALGAGLAVISILLNKPWSLLLIGLVFVIETASVIIQVVSYKTTGKRVFKMSPIHHHFEEIGWSEKKVVGVFWLVGIICAVLYTYLF